MLPDDVFVKTTVDSGQPPGTTFDNTAYSETEPTNTTYHLLKGDWRVTEQYYVYDTGPTNTKLDTDLVTTVGANASYSVQGPLDSLAGYTYYGYQRVGIDNDIIPGDPPDPAYNDAVGSLVHSATFTDTNQETIKLYYRRTEVNVTINYVDQFGNVLKAPTTQVVPVGQDYTLLPSYFDSFTVGSATWNYFDYAKEADGSVADVAPPVPSKVPGTAPVYPDSATPTFPASLMDTDKNITLYFSASYSITERFHDLEGNELDSTTWPDKFYNVADGSSFNSLNDPTGKSLPPARIGDYAYVGYRIGSDSDPVTYGDPPIPLIGTVSSDETIIYVYDLAYTDFSFTKQNATGVGLEGVQFRLTPQDSSGSGWDSAAATTVSSDKDGLVAFNSLLNGTYLFEEIKTEQGYALPAGHWELSVVATASPAITIKAIGSPMAFQHDKDGNLILNNYPNWVTPFAGKGFNVMFLTAIGVFFICLDIWFIIAMRRKRALMGT